MDQDEAEGEKVKNKKRGWEKKEGNGQTQAKPTLIDEKGFSTFDSNHLLSLSSSSSSTSSSFSFSLSSSSFFFPSPL